MGMHIGATWRIRLNPPRAAAASPPFCQITLITVVVVDVDADGVVVVVVVYLCHGP